MELVIKGVCLLPHPQWDRVPRRQIKEDLVRQNLIVDGLYYGPKKFLERSCKIFLKSIYQIKMSKYNRT